ncbi:hypothetical protein BVG16_27780 [Paenibacillus selenitireducens]|uniref:Uncharacterized protein n=1 Tax=Paenibacillus selenitireducens TaxID=1324314 RepID=A0A1T2X156_9BACL|nr:hypothetical protein [Paenibacillus selenitireducens]OPA73610.1 hypothetical protein BVG16_27780 [Paenibacillus selenitireducens]
MNITKTLIFCIISVLCVVLIISGCGSNKQPVQGGSSSEGLDQLLAKTNQDGAFVFERLPWLISKQEVIEKQKLDNIQSKDADRLIGAGSIPLDASVKQTVIYNFQDDQLVSGEYWFTTSDKNHFVELGKELKGLFSKSLSEPQTGNIALLDQADVSAQQGGIVAW